MGAPTPPTFNEPIASDASSPYITNPMPDAPTGTNAASVQQGFPPITMQDELSGGQPPLGPDINGFLLLLSSHIFAQQAGQGYSFNSTVEGAISGYNNGAILAMADGTGLWLSLLNNNSNDPDTGIGNWVPLASYGTAIVTTTGGTTTLNVNQWKKNIIRVQGALTSNAKIILVDTIGQWIISNETTGAFTLTVQMSALGASVQIPQTGLSAPTAVFSPDASDLYATNMPGQNLQTNGYQKLPGGMILQWGVAVYSGSGTTLVINYNIPFPNASLIPSAGTELSGAQPGMKAQTTTQLTLDMTALVGTGQSIFWQAIGY
jgi:hypothetical protein